MDNIEDWVDAAQPERVLFRQAVHTILHAITIDDFLRANMIMKGGMLLGIRHGSSRFTTDIDFSTIKRELSLDNFTRKLNEALTLSADELPYTLECAIQSSVLQPSQTATYPSFKLKIGYADTTNKGSLKRLRNGESPHIVKIDYSLNEESYDTEEINISEDEECIIAYSIIDLLAEKLRSIIQQVVRHRNRRQDIYDVWHLLSKYSFTPDDLASILDSFKKKSLGRIDDEYINKDALAREDIIQASRHEYNLLADEVEGDLPDFDEAYSKVRLFFESLPWT